MLPLMTPLPSSLIPTQSRANSAELDTRSGLSSSSDRSKTPCLSSSASALCTNASVQDGVGDDGEAASYRIVAPLPCWRPVLAPLTTPVANATGFAMDVSLREQVCGGNAAALWRAEA
ncbi:hypothetical protein PVAP13_3NG034280 [Panicum virgatum]|uniref:Uncharacterized protein n=1 Tax=Panicum virgatum TaxID=38727 RepID=A0A8T0U2N5_PANVG|nr:hypothetical protein PVAP13_3NG034280 [Panicum virgatum]